MTGNNIKSSWFHIRAVLKKELKELTEQVKGTFNVKL